MPQILSSKVSSDFDFDFTSYLFIFSAQRTTSALPDVFSGRGHQIIDQKVPNFTLKCQKLYFGNHPFRDKFTKSRNTAE